MYYVVQQMVILQYIFELKKKNKKKMRLFDTSLKIIRKDRNNIFWTHYALNDLITIANRLEIAWNHYTHRFPKDNRVSFVSNDIRSKLYACNASSGRWNDSKLHITARGAHRAG